VGPRRGPLGGHLPGLGPATGHFDGDAGWTLRVLAGPHPDWFDVDVLEQLRGTVFVVDPASDRVGLRLVPADGAGALRRRAGELASQPMVTGAVQVPPSGAPVVLGPDHATLGGYPVVATVIAADLCLAGRCRPGDRVGFALVDASTARAARRRQLRALGQAVQGHYPTASGT
jgi:allophanate hydrolase subunit 2